MAVIVSAALVSGTVASADQAGDLFAAASAGDVAKIRQLLGQRFDVNSPNSRGWTPLMVAALNGHREAVRSLLEGRANPDLLSQDGATALMAASLRGHVDVVRALVMAGAKVDIQNLDGITALTIAQQKGYLEIARLLESMPINLNGTYQGTVAGRSSDPLNVSIVQEGRSFSGTWNTASASGTLTGTVISRNAFTLRWRQEAPCLAEFGGVGTIGDSGSTLTASYRGADCHGSLAATVVVNRSGR